MKRGLIVMMLTMLCMAAGLAQSNADNQRESETITPANGSPTVSEIADQDGLTKVKPGELPDAVKKALDKPEFKGWIINAAYYDEKKERYQVQLKNGADTRTVKFGRDGAVLAE